MNHTEFLSVCEKIVPIITDALASLIGTEYGAEELCMGADNTPTERLDKIAEDIVLAAFREHKVCKYLLSEEAGMVDIGGESGIAYLDPVDGSFNAGAGIPFYALSIGLSDGEKMVAGYVRNLASDETFTAIRGQGAYLNGKPIGVSKKTELNTSAMCVYARAPEMMALLQRGFHIRRVRKLGASAIELCYVACGRLDGFLDLRTTLRITDAAAGILICEEAGGIVSLPDGSPVSFPDDVRLGRPILAANPVIHTKVSEIMRLE
ncbi:MAG TPA: bifunctional fructose-bisphosphatase/inositol-phosphate phosphatase [Methanocorpusculum sp.]|nr:bifunctional fructose-bisphosphatase/inositol-phosphate phosphatase [Methanocorpusculum sp.]